MSNSRKDDQVGGSAIHGGKDLAFKSYDGDLALYSVKALDKACVKIHCDNNIA